MNFKNRYLPLKILIINKAAYLAKLLRVNIKILYKILARDFILDRDQIASQAINYGIKSLLIFFIIFLFWAIFIPIKSAAIGEGIIVLDFNKKIIQHLEGGIVEKILVTEGQEVKIGDPVIFIHDIKAKSEQQIILSKLWTMMLQKQRLIAEKNAEKNNDSEINIQEFLSKIGEVDGEDQTLLDEIIDTQAQLFSAKKAKSKGEINVLTKKFDQAKNQLIAVESQEKAARKKLVIVRKELKLIKPLVAENNLSILRQDDLEKEMFELEGRSGELVAEISRSKQQIAEAELTIANYKNDDLAKIFDEMKIHELLDGDIFLNRKQPVKGVAICGRCKNEYLFVEMKQTRASDEPISVFFYCPNCGNRWREG